MPQNSKSLAPAQFRGISMQCPPTPCSAVTPPISSVIPCRPPAHTSTCHHQAKQPFAEGSSVVPPLYLPLPVSPKRVFKIQKHQFSPPWSTGSPLGLLLYRSINLVSIPAKPPPAGLAHATPTHASCLQTKPEISYSAPHPHPPDPPPVTEADPPGNSHARPARRCRCLRPRT